MAPFSMTLIDLDLT